MNYQQRLTYVTPIIVLILFSATIITVVDLIITSQYLLAKISLAKIGSGDQKVTLFKIRIYKSAVIVLPVVFIIGTLFSSLNTHKIRKTNAGDKYVSIMERPTLEDYFDKWFEKNIEDSVFRGKNDTIYLVSGQGGGSRAGAWFFMNMVKNEKEEPNFFRKVFSISTVSGSSVGAYMYLGMKYYNISAKKIDIKEKSRLLFARNYLSSALWGLLVGDGLDGIANHFLSSKNDFPKDRNYYLQKDEMAGFQKAFTIEDATDYFEGDFYHIYEDTSTRFPLFFINTAIIEKGTQGIFSPVKLDSVSLARDLYAAFKRGDKNGGYNLPLTSCVNQSQAFPLISSYNYMDCVGRFIDGGIYENTGCGTTLEVYETLRKYLNLNAKYKEKGIKIVLYNIANTSMSENNSMDYKNASILNSLTAIINSPFGGHQNFAYKNLGRQVKYFNNIWQIRDTVIPITLKYDITLTRFLSDSAIGMMYKALNGN